MRKLVATSMVKEGEGSVAAVTKHMTHSVSVAQSNYQQIQGTSNSVKAYEMITGKRQREDNEEPEAKKRRFYTKEQEGIIVRELNLMAKGYIGSNICR